MSVRLFHQNMRNFGGVGRANEFVTAFGQARVADFNGDRIAIAGFTEITNANSTVAALTASAQALQGQAMAAPIFFAAGTTYTGSLQEYVAICVDQYTQVDACAASYLYVSQADPRNVLIYVVTSQNAAAMANLPPGTIQQGGVTYSLGINYRCIAFVQVTMQVTAARAVQFVAGFTHNVCQSGDPGKLITYLPKVCLQVCNALNIDETDWPIIIGGDFNGRPHNVGIGGVPLQAFRYQQNGKDVNTTRANCLDFWFSSVDELDGQGPDIDNGSCDLHPQPLLMTYNGTTTTLSDHAGISIIVY